MLGNIAFIENLCATPFSEPHRPKDLGPNQIAWLKQNVPQFGPAKEAADRALQHAAEIKAQMEGAS